MECSFWSVKCNHLNIRAESVIWAGATVSQPIFVKFEWWVRWLWDFSRFWMDFQHLVASTTKHSDKHVIAQSDAAISTRKIEEENDLFVSRTEEPRVGCPEQSTYLLGCESSILKAKLN
jgi:hypothetical protein